MQEKLCTVDVILEHNTNKIEIERDELGSQSGIQAPTSLLYPYMSQLTKAELDSLGDVKHYSLSKFLAI